MSCHKFHGKWPTTGPGSSLQQTAIATSNYKMYNIYRLLCIDFSMPHGPEAVDCLHEFEALRKAIESLFDKSGACLHSNRVKEW